MEELLLLKKENGELLSLKNKYEEQLVEYEQLKEKHKELKESTDKQLQNQIKPIEAKCRQDINYLNKELEAYKKTVDKLNKNLRDETRLERKLTEATKLLKIKDTKIERFEKELDGYIKEIEKLNEDSRKLSEGTNLLQIKEEQIEKFEKEIEELQTDSKAKINIIEKLELQVAKLNEKITDVQIINSNLQAKIMDVNHQFLNSKSLLDEYNTKINVVL